MNEPTDCQIDYLVIYDIINVFTRSTTISLLIGTDFHIGVDHLIFSPSLEWTCDEEML